MQSKNLRDQRRPTSKDNVPVVTLSASLRHGCTPGNRVTPVWDDANVGSLELPDVDMLVGASLAELTAALRQVDQVLRHAEVARARIVALAERSEAYRLDGHRAVTNWIRAATNVSRSTSIAAAQTARLITDIDAAATAATAGVLGVDQLRSVAAVYANPRVQESFPGSAELLVDHARQLWFDDYRVVLERWTALADADGAHRHHDHVWRHRNAQLSLVAGEMHLSARGPALAGGQLQEVLDRFTDAEFIADWEQARELYGDDTCADLLARTPGQRRFDALLALARQAASNAGGRDPQPLVNIVVDHATFEHHLARRLGVDVEPLDPAEVDQRRCETSTGIQLDPDDVLAAAVFGRVRRVVMDAAGIVVDQGRTRRLFTGRLRDAVLVAQHWCTWVGCDRRSDQCQTDHSRPFAHDGPTNTHNGNAACGFHNRFKHQRGYRTWRDPTTRQWHIQRPDGTILARPDYLDHDPYPHPLAGW